MAQPNLSQDQRYPVTITGRHFDLTPAIEQHVYDKLRQVEHFIGKVTHGTAVLDAHKHDCSCAIVLNLPDHQIKVNGHGVDMYKAIDICGEKLNGLLSRYKDKMKSHHNKPLHDVSMDVDVIRAFNDDLKQINDDIDAENARRNYERTHFHEIVGSESIVVKTYTQEEAIMKMEFSSAPFMIYRSEEDQKLKVIYRREDDNYNLVQVQS
jgi:putative sigma-54 modulation protein